MQEKTTESRILDASGRPFKQREAKALQTDDVRLIGLQRTFSQHPSSGLTPASAANILQAAEQGDLIAQCELAEDIEEKDGHL
jgi:phage gp29-like protein